MRPKDKEALMLKLRQSIIDTRDYNIQQLIWDYLIWEHRGVGVSIMSMYNAVHSTGCIKLSFCSISRTKLKANPPVVLTADDVTRVDKWEIPVEALIKFLNRKPLQYIKTDGLSQWIFGGDAITWMTICVNGDKSTSKKLVSWLQKKFPKGHTVEWLEDAKWPHTLYLTEEDSGPALYHNGRYFDLDENFIRIG